MLKAVGYIDDRFYSEASAENGRRRHKATQLVDTHGAFHVSVDDEDLMYVEAWRSFVREWNFKPRLIETPLYHPTFLFGVTPDREGLILEGEPAVVEIKTGLMPWWTKYQAALQVIALEAWDNDIIYRRRIGVQIAADGLYNAVEFSDPADYDIARCIASVCMANENKLWKEMRETGYFANTEFI